MYCRGAVLCFCSLWCYRCHVVLSLRRYVVMWSCGFVNYLALPGRHHSKAVAHTSMTMMTMMIITCGIVIVIVWMVLSMLGRYVVMCSVVTSSHQVLGTSWSSSLKGRRSYTDDEDNDDDNDDDDVWDCDCVDGGGDCAVIFVIITASLRGGEG